MRSAADKFIDKLNRLRPWQVALIFLTVALAVFATGIFGDWQDDDYQQIVNNNLVHSINGIPELFKGGTFYGGNAVASGSGTLLVGDYYRPLMETTFALIYAVAGAVPFWFHFVQILLVALAAFVFYLFLAKLVRPPCLAMMVSLVFLVHPVNSQNAFAIPCMQEPLFFLLGAAALWMLSRSETDSSLVAASICLWASLFAKETGVVFIAIAMVYLWMYRRNSLLKFIGMMVVPVALYLLLKLRAVGFGFTASSQIDHLSFGQRLLNIPSIIFLYIVLFIFPIKIASRYYDVITRVSLFNFWLPLLAVTAAVALMVLGGWMLKRWGTPNHFKAYVFFGVWSVLGMIPNLQLVALDSTATPPWMYISAAGLLGVVGVILAAFWEKVNRRVLLLTFVAILILLGIRTAIRGLDWASSVTLARSDISVSDNNYMAYGDLAYQAMAQKDYKLGIKYGEKAASIFPSQSIYLNLVGAKLNNGDCAGARSVNTKVVSLFNDSRFTWTPMLTLCSGDPATNLKELKSAVGNQPNNMSFWVELAIAEQKDHNNEAAKTDITTANSLGRVPSQIYDGIMRNLPFEFNIPNTDIHVQVP
jgi:hypothetical protein